MTEVVVLLDTQGKMGSFVAACEKHHGDVTAYSGRYVINGKSLMGYFSLDWSKPIKVEFDGHITEEIKKMIAPLVVRD